MLVCYIAKTRKYALLLYYKKVKSSTGMTIFIIKYTIFLIKKTRGRQNDQLKSATWNCQ
jgi:hypothetical protein